MSVTEIILLWLLLSVLAVAWSVTRSLGHDRADWRRSATSLALIVRGLDAWPVVETVFEIAASGDEVAPGRPTPRTMIVIPPSVAVIGRPTALDRWSTTASKALAEYDALVDPEGR